MKERSAAVSVVGGSESNLRDSMQSEDVVKCLHAHVTCGTFTFTYTLLLSKATYNWGVHKAINLEEANIQRKFQ